MYRYTDFDRQFVQARAAQYRDQLERHFAGELPDEAFRPLRLQNGWYVQRHAPMLPVTVPCGALQRPESTVNFGFTGLACQPSLMSSLATHYPQPPRLPAFGPPP